MHRAIFVAVLIAGAAPLAAQQKAPLRSLTASVATDSGVLRNISGVRQLPDGRVLVNDAQRHRVLAFDSTLAGFTVVLDTAGGQGDKYGKEFGGLIPYLGDSTLFVDGDARAFVVLDPQARVIRTIAALHVTDIGYLTNSYYGIPGVDAKGRLIYRTVRSSPPLNGPPPQPSDRTPQIIISRPDSAPILRADFEARTVDTIAMLALGPQKAVMSKMANGVTVGFSAHNPLPAMDEWAVLSDGTLALARTHDYHVDWIGTDGSITASPKLPFDWRAITMDEKVHLIDSIRQADADRRAKAPVRLPTMAEVMNSGSTPLPFVTVEPGDLPDYYPPIRQGQVKADRDGNVWVLPATSSLARSGLVWDVVNRKGEVTAHVELPEGRNIAGFGPGGIVYMMYVAPGKVQLERARVKTEQ